MVSYQTLTVNRYLWNIKPTKQRQLYKRVYSKRPVNVYQA